MSSINNGGQSLYFSYLEPATGKGFNKTVYKLLSRGIYSGGDLIRVTDSQIQVNPMICFFEDTVNEIGVKISSAAAATVNLTPATPYIIGRFTWLDSDQNFMDFLSVGFSSIQNDDLVFGKALYSGAVLTSFDYNRKTWSKYYYNKNQDYYPPFMVVANEPYDTKVNIIKGGSAIVDGQYYTIADNTQSPSFVLPVTSGRIDVLTLNQNGQLEIIKGVDSASPVKPLVSYRRFPLAYVQFPAAASTVVGTYIQYINKDEFKNGDINYMDVVVSGQWAFNNTTQSNSVSTGAVTISGGLGVGKNVNIGGNVTVAGTTLLSGGLLSNGSTINAGGLSLLTLSGLGNVWLTALNQNLGYGNVVETLHGQQRFFTVGNISFTPPSGISTIYISGAAAGGNGGNNIGGGGGGGEWCYKTPFSVIPGVTISGAIGAVGANTTLGSFTLNFGKNGTASAGGAGGAGGTGGSGISGGNGGSSASSSPQTGQPGVGGFGSGGSGGYVAGGTGFWGGGGGGCGANGVSSGTNAGYGGGGGGGNGSGGAGGQGFLIVEW